MTVRQAPIADDCHGINLRSAICHAHPAAGIAMQFIASCQLEDPPLDVVNALSGIAQRLEATGIGRHICRIVAEGIATTALAISDYRAGTAEPSNGRLLFSLHLSLLCLRLSSQFSELLLLPLSLIQDLLLFVLAGD